MNRFVLWFLLLLFLVSFLIFFLLSLIIDWLNGITFFARRGLVPCQHVGNKDKNLLFFEIFCEDVDTVLDIFEVSKM